jgi:ribosomal protein L4
LTNSKVITVSELNTYSILHAHNLVFTEDAVVTLQQNIKA